ncbi:ATP-dependent sacrificial sulfur transferase LarE [Bacillus sp. T33-2]|uniref:ATP-dependent sacrificial sulfur transferase LarE n=1 Tax=Bacillus sp. T33-2 TaxID=2054168 RepID=UPI000C77AF8C|nr:ATP-dependent sacrificial sulfur transferase LarE [Bacillus sp. T33-2]PLR94672.1 TIGR00268 family protein [Bacillus sp. T33-2]
MDVYEKYNQLKHILQELDSVVVAFSGGVDSTFLAKVALDVLGPDKVIAVTADSETYPSSELNESISIAKEMGITHKVLSTSELAIPGYVENDLNRCYFCKKGLFTELEPILKKYKYKNIIFGLIADDMSDYRPGVLAAREHGVRGPLQEAQLYKEEIRFLSKKLNLRTWDKPSFACLSSRIAYGEQITAEKLTRVDQSEELLKNLGLKQVRVRTHGDIARIEVEPHEIEKVLEKRRFISEKLINFGYQYVTVDLLGYKSGSMNKALHNVETYSKGIEVDEHVKS